MAPVTIKTNTRGWTEQSTTSYWTSRVLHHASSIPALYAVVQDTGASPKIRVLKADSDTAPTVWTEQDSANAKTIASTTSSFCSWYDPTSAKIHVVCNNSLATYTHYRFDCATNLWTSGFGIVSSSAVSPTRPVRVVVRSD